MWDDAAMRTAAIILAWLVGCGKSAPETSDKVQPGSAPPMTGSGSAAGSAAATGPVEAAAVVGPTKSASGAVEVSGALTGSFEWKKQDQRAPITCIFDPEKDIGTLKIDLSDGAGHLLTVGIDVPPAEAGAGRLEVRSKDLPSLLKTYAGFRLNGDDANEFSAVFDGAEAVTDADAQLANKGKKNAAKPAGPTLVLKGKLTVTCPKKK
jgi:hypothetical protein